MYNQNFLQVDQPIRLQYSNQIKLLLTINVTCFIWFIGYFYQLADEIIVIKIEESLNFVVKIKL
jgi:hypothetical protein